MRAVMTCWRRDRRHNLGTQPAGDLTSVRVTCAGRTVAFHNRCWAKHQTITDPEHRAAAAVLRRLPRAAQPPFGEVETRSLTDYDAAFGLTEEVA